MHLRVKASSLYITKPNGIREKIFGIEPYLATFNAIMK